MPRLRLFGPAAQAAGTHADTVDGTTVADAVALATGRYGPAFATVVPHCRIWVNGEPATADTPLGEDDEVALLPPVSGG